MELHLTLRAKGIANPTALLLSAVMMLNHIGEPKAALILSESIDLVLKDKLYHTVDLGGVSTTQMFSDRLCEVIQAYGK